jgi:two-component system sensor histidine kinase UhpB
VLQILDQLAALQDVANARHQQEINVLYRQVRTRLLTMGAGTMVVALMVAVMASRHVNRLQHEIERQRHIERDNREDLERLSARLVDVQEQERRTLARELHDEVGQALTAVALRAEAAAADSSHQDAALREIGEAVQGSLDDLRRIANRLRPEALDDLGLVNALIALCNRVSRQGDIAIRRNLAADLPQLTPETELVVYRVAQEALTNVLRHSSATRATVSLIVPDGRVTLKVSDNGRGLDDVVPQRTGVAGMRERALLVGGEFAIGPGQDGGVEVRLTLP